MQITPTTIQASVDPAVAQVLSKPEVALPSAAPLREQFLAQVLRILAQSESADVRILKTRAVIQIQASIPLKEGQLVLLQRSADGISLQTGSMATTE